MFEIQYFGGLRVSELINLRTSNIDFKNLKLQDIEDVKLNKWHKHCKIKILGKGNKERRVLIKPDITYKLLAYCPSKFRDYFKNRNDTKIFDVGAIRYREILSQIGKRVLNKRVYPHLIRHSRAFSLFEDNVNLIFIRDYLGHDSIATTQKYLIRDKSKSLDAIESSELEKRKAME